MQMKNVNDKTVSILYKLKLEVPIQYSELF